MILISTIDNSPMAISYCTITLHTYTPIINIRAQYKNIVQTTRHPLAHCKLSQYSIAYGPCAKPSCHRELGSGELENVGMMNPSLVHCAEA